MKAVCRFTWNRLTSVILSLTLVIPLPNLIFEIIITFKIDSRNKTKSKNLKLQVNLILAMCMMMPSFIC